LKATKTNTLLCASMDDKKIVDAISLVVEFSQETFNSEIAPPPSKMKALGNAIGFLWDLPPIRETYHRRGDRFSFPDNMDHFLNKAEIIYSADFNPSRDDALKTRIRTTGLIDRRYEIKENFFHICDVGGQRNERKKWIHSFESVTALIFVAALNHYNAVLFEDEKQNAMHESIQLFEEICNSKWFRQTEIILFLNKDDLFREMLREGYSLKKCFHIKSGWEGEQWDPEAYAEQFESGDEKQFMGMGGDYEYECVDYVRCEDTARDNEVFEVCYKNAIKFVQRQYVKKNKNTAKLVFVHVTTATNRDNVEKVFWDVQNMIIRSNLKRGGIV